MFVFEGCCNSPIWSHTLQICIWWCPCLSRSLYQSQLCHMYIPPRSHMQVSHFLLPAYMCDRTAKCKWVVVHPFRLGIDTTSSCSACSSWWFLLLSASFVSHALGRFLMSLDRVLYPTIPCFYASFAFGTHHCHRTTIISHDKCLSWIEHPNPFQLHPHMLLDWTMARYTVDPLMLEIHTPIPPFYICKFIPLLVSTSTVQTEVVKFKNGTFHTLSFLPCCREFIHK